MGDRPVIPFGIQTAVLTKSGRRCALCFGLAGDLSEKPGQLAHVNRDSSDNTEGNLAYLCLPHHDQYDSRTSQSKGLTAGELLTYREALYAHVVLSRRSQPAFALSSDAPRDDRAATTKTTTPDQTALTEGRAVGGDYGLTPAETHALRNALRALLPIDGPPELAFRAVSRSHVSLVAECQTRGHRYVIKRTKRELCDLAALRQLTEGFTPLRTTKAHLLVPVALHATSDYVWELVPWYHGVSLRNIAVRNRYCIGGVFLSEAYNDLLQNLHELHRIGVVHRDIRPQNILMSLDDGRLALGDWSFCASVNSTQTPIGNALFTPPEQRVGMAVPLSDVFALAVSILFVGAGGLSSQSPEAIDAAVDATDFGTYEPNFAPHRYGVPPGFRGFFRAILHPDPRRRPSSLTELLLREHTDVFRYLDLQGILDIGDDRYLRIGHSNAALQSRDELDSWLRTLKANEYKIVLPDGQRRGDLSTALVNDIEAHLRGSNPWTNTMEPNPAILADSRDS